MAIDVSEQVQQKQGCRIITGGRYGGVTVGHQRSHKGEIDQRGDHSAHAAFNIAVGQDFDKVFKPVMGKPVQVRKRLLVGKGNICIDFVELFSYAGDGEFFKGVHHIPFDPGGSGNFCPDYPIRFRLKPLPSGYNNTSLIMPCVR